MCVDEKIKFMLDGNPFHKGEGIVKSFNDDEIVVQLTKECKEYPEGNDIIISYNEVYCPTWLEIYEFCYRVLGVESRRPFGRITGHPYMRDMEEAFISSPIKFDEKLYLITSSSGRKYRIQSYSGNKEEILEELRKHIVQVNLKNKEKDARI